jgi:hypothetical protein
MLIRKRQAKSGGTGIFIPTIWYDDARILFYFTSHITSTSTSKNLLFRPIVDHHHHDYCLYPFIHDLG